jgi:hypothetical protein
MNSKQGQNKRLTRVRVAICDSSPARMDFSNNLVENRKKTPLTTSNSSASSIISTAYNRRRIQIQGNGKCITRNTGKKEDPERDLLAFSKSFKKIKRARTVGAEKARSAAAGLEKENYDAKKSTKKQQQIQKVPTRRSAGKPSAAGRIRRTQSDPLPIRPKGCSLLRDFLNDQRFQEQQQSGLQTPSSSLLSVSSPLIGCKSYNPVCFDKESPHFGTFTFEPNILNSQRRIQTTCPGCEDCVFADDHNRRPSFVTNQLFCRSARPSLTPNTTGTDWCSNLTTEIFEQNSISNYSANSSCKIPFACNNKCQHENIGKKTTTVSSKVPPLLDRDSSQQLISLLAQTSEACLFQTPPRSPLYKQTPKIEVQMDDTPVEKAPYFPTADDELTMTTEVNCKNLPKELMDTPCRLRRQIALRKKRSFSLVPPPMDKRELSSVGEKSEGHGENGEQDDDEYGDGHTNEERKIHGGKGKQQKMQMDETITFLRNYKKVIFVWSYNPITSESESPLPQSL